MYCFAKKCIVILIKIVDTKNIEKGHMGSPQQGEDKLGNYKAHNLVATCYTCGLAFHSSI